MALLWSAGFTTNNPPTKEETILLHLWDKLYHLEKKVIENVKGTQQISDNLTEFEKHHV